MQQKSILIYMQSLIIKTAKKNIRCVITNMENNW